MNNGFHSDQITGRKPTDFNDYRYDGFFVLNFTDTSITMLASTNVEMIIPPANVSIDYVNELIADAHRKLGSLSNVRPIICCVGNVYIVKVVDLMGMEPSSQNRALPAFRNFFNIGFNTDSVFTRNYDVNNNIVALSTVQIKSYQLGELQNSIEEEGIFVREFGLTIGIGGNVVCKQFRDNSVLPELVNMGTMGVRFVVFATKEFCNKVYTNINHAVLELQPVESQDGKNTLQVFVRAKDGIEKAHYFDLSKSMDDATTLKLGDEEFTFKLFNRYRDAKEYFVAIPQVELDKLREENRILKAKVNDATTTNESKKVDTWSKVIKVFMDLTKFFALPAKLLFKIITASP